MDGPGEPSILTLLKDFKTTAWLSFIVPIALFTLLVDAYIADKVSLGYVLGNGAVFLVSIVLVAGCFADLEDYEIGANRKLRSISHLRMLIVLFALALIMFYTKVKPEERISGGAWGLGLAAIIGASMIGIGCYVAVAAEKTAKNRADARSAD